MHQITEHERNPVFIKSNLFVLLGVLISHWISYTEIKTDNLISLNYQTGTKMNSALSFRLWVVKD